MTGQSVHSTIWALVRRQHGVISRAQLLALGLSRHGIAHRVETGRLHPVFPGVYAVGRPEVSQRGCWMAAVLFCGEGAVLSHESAAALYCIRGRAQRAEIEVSVPAGRNPRTEGIRIHRRTTRLETGWYDGIPVTSPLATLIDLAARLPKDDLEAAINEADKRDLIHVDALREALHDVEPRPGLRQLRQIIDRRTFVYTDSKLERVFLPLALRAGLPQPETQRYVNSYRVDFLWRLLKLLVETDGLRYHRTPLQQNRDLVRSQLHKADGWEVLRFSHAQIRYEPAHVEDVLRRTAQRLAAAA